MARNSKEIAVSIKNRLIKTSVCILFLMHTATASKRSAKPNKTLLRYLRGGLANMSVKSFRFKTCRANLLLITAIHI